MSSGVTASTTIERLRKKAKEYPNLRYLVRDRGGPEALFGEMLSESL